MSLKLKITVILFLVLGLQSCVDSFLNQLPKSTSAPETFYKTDADFKLALSGCYEAINTASITNVATVATGTYNYGLFYFLDGCSDVAIPFPTSFSGIDMLRGSYLTNQPEINNFWIAFYVGISRCNYLLDYIDKSTLTSQQKTLYIGEARFLRAFYYLHLAKMFGGVPITNTSTPDPKAPRNTLQEVYTFILDDLTYANANLGTTGTFQSSANKWTAGAYLGETYNYLASCKRYNVGIALLPKCPLNDFSWVDADLYSIKARDILKSVIDGRAYTLVSRADYPKLFHEMSKVTQYKECLLMSEFAGGNSSDAMLIFYLFSPTGTTYGGSYQRVFPTMKLYKSYESSTVSADIRRDMFITGGYPTSKTTLETVDNYSYFVPSVSSGTSSGGVSSAWCTGKFRCVDPSSRTAISKIQCTTNYPLMRMADVHLQYAEALYFSGDETDARAQLDTIRARVTTNLAALHNAYTKPDFVEELLDERMRELCFESKRRIDLVRFAKTTDYINGLALEGTANLQSSITTVKSYWNADHSSDYKIWLPIPQLQTEINTNLVQNAGY
jgi:starch-binding outer membrane protein, SusD/RagB family